MELLHDQLLYKRAVLEQLLIVATVTVFRRGSDVGVGGLCHGKTSHQSRSGNSDYHHMIRHRPLRSSAGA